MGTEILVRDLSPVAVARLQAEGFLVQRHGAPAGAATRWMVSGSAARAAAILDAESDEDASRRIALQRCPPVPVPADLLAVLIKAALGADLGDKEIGLLQDELAGLATAAKALGRLRAAKTTAEVEALGDSFWQT